MFHIARKQMGHRRQPPSLSLRASWDWPGECERCGAKINWGTAERSSGTKTVWDTPSGDLEPGCLYWTDILPRVRHDLPYKHYCSGNWANCDEKHLYAVLPNGHHWDIDSRARNCGSPEDRLHRCWRRHGDPPHVTVDKNGPTCSAGAGSIMAGDYHGFLQNGQFT